MGVFVIAMKKMAKKCFDGDLVMPKVNFWMLTAICLLAGTVFGLLAAPATHGIIIGSNSGNRQYKNDYGEENGKKEGKSR